MDNGQPTKQDNTQPFFTAGTGDSSTSPIEPENNLDLSNKEANWSVSPDRDPKSIGNAAIFSPNDNTGNLETGTFSANTPQSSDQESLGQIINLEMPPGVEKTDNTPVASVNQDTSDPVKAALNPMISGLEIKTTEKLSKGAIEAISNLENKLNQDGKIFDFYDAIRGEEGLTEENLKNSYGREVA